jgi:hypothetical protein
MVCKHYCNTICQLDGKFCDLTEGKESIILFCADYDEKEVIQVDKNSTS